MGMLLTVLAILLVIGSLVWYPQSGRSVRPARAARQRPGPSVPARAGGIDTLHSNALSRDVDLAQTGCEAAANLRDQRSQIRRTHPDRREVVRFDLKKPNRRARVSRRRADKWVDHTY